MGKTRHIGIVRLLILLGCVAIWPGNTDAQIIPADRMIDWKPGIPGGIPVYPVGLNVKDAPYSAKGDGKADDTQAIQNAINDCPNGKAVFLPEGTYRITTQIVIKNKGVALRGAGVSKTRILSEFGSFAGDKRASIYIGGGYTVARSGVTAGFERGSNHIAASQPADFKIGDLIAIMQDNDPAVLEKMRNTNPYQGQLVQITEKNGNTLTLSRPLYYTYNPAMNVRIAKIGLTEGAGVEDLYFELTNTTPDPHQDNCNIFIAQAVHCWVKNIESNKCNKTHVVLCQCLGCEVRHNYFHDGIVHNTSIPYGVQVCDRATDNLVEDNVFYMLHVSMLAQDAATGNVFGYNYSHRLVSHDFKTENDLGCDMAFHGGNANLNLFEGNVGVQAGSDYTWGSNRANTFFRNHIERYSINGAGQPVKWGKRAVLIHRANLGITVVGNILCRPGDTDSDKVWDVGNDGSYGGGYDERVPKTLIRHGNFDFTANHGAGETQWDPAIKDREIPKSLYLKDKPSFFGDLAWPPFGPDLKPMIGKLPAKVRYMKKLNTDKEDEAALDRTGERK
jgi:hypothetical protein